MEKERLNLVIVGHVDHGKSTVIGRLLADTGSLPQGKLDQVKATCAKNARPFEYAFLLDALKDEQAQGITIDSARCFFETQKRYYIVMDAPGHIEFLKNMVTGAARADSALIVIDAFEGIQENTKRHGYLISMLGVKQVTVLVNKMDLVDYSQEVFEKTRTEYLAFLEHLNVKPLSFIPISAFEGDNIVSASKNIPWYKGPSVLEQIDKMKKPNSDDKLNMPFRFPVQDIYKFTALGDDRRNFAGTIETGSVEIGQEVVFLPSGKKSSIKTIEEFNVPVQSRATAGQALGFTLDTQVYIEPGELMARTDQPLPNISSRFRANIFWMGNSPLIQEKAYKLKLGSKRIPVKLVEIINVLDASNLSSIKNKQQVDKHDVGECVFETSKPIAFDLLNENEYTGRFVIVDHYDIAGGGVILEKLSDTETNFKKQIEKRELTWESGLISAKERSATYRHKPKFILFTGEHGVGKRIIAKSLEKKLFDHGLKAYYLVFSNLNLNLEMDSRDGYPFQERSKLIRRIGSVARIMTDAGLIFLTTSANFDDFDLEKIRLLTAPNEFLVINVGKNHFNHFKPDLILETDGDIELHLDQIYQLLSDQMVLEYYI
ncbi:MAG: GTP-binding protein [Deltaproteobacteria bacterium]|nr:GTP-binding protein [Deltaproteobacteria bacterium]